MIPVEMRTKAIRAQIDQLMQELEAMTEDNAPTVDVTVMRIKISKLRRLLEQSEGLMR